MPEQLNLFDTNIYEIETTSIGDFDVSRPSMEHSINTVEFKQLELDLFPRRLVWIYLTNHDELVA